MGKGDDLILPCENHVMISYYCTTAHRRKSNFFFVSFLPSGASVINIGVFIIKFFIDGIRQRQRGAAGGIHLLVVVLFHNFDVKASRGQHASRFLQKLQQQVDSQRHIGRFQNRRLTGKGLHPLQLLRGKSRSAQHTGHQLCFTVIQQLIHSGCRRKINGHIRQQGTVLPAGLPVILQAFINRISVGNVVGYVHSRYYFHIGFRFHQTGNHLSHVAVAAVHQYFYHIITIRAGARAFLPNEIRITGCRNPSWPSPASPHFPLPFPSAAFLRDLPPVPSGSWPS